MVERCGFDKSTTAAGLSELTHFAYDLVPALRDFDVERTWAGLRPGTFDGFPYVGAISGLDNAFAAAGHFRSGLHLSTGTAVVRLLTGEHDLRAHRGQRASVLLAATTGTTGDDGLVATLSDAHVYDQPDANAHSIQSLKKGTRVRVLRSEGDDWYVVALDRATEKE
jgi:hypothetical protein